jgi:hypothetical protein
LDSKRACSCVWGRKHEEKRNKNGKEKEREKLEKEIKKMNG